MPYVLGIDVGTARTRAAVCRRDPTRQDSGHRNPSRRATAGWTPPTPIGLGTQHPWLPTVVHLGTDHSVLVGEEAERHTTADPGRTARGFGRRIGDDVPLLLGGQPCEAPELTAVLVRWIVDVVAAREGGPADRLVLSHPASWGAHRRGLLHRELGRQGLANATMVPEPIAVAEGLADQLEPDAVLAVFGLGAGLPEAAVVRHRPTGGFDLLASAEGADPAGGGHFDDAVLACVRAAVGRAMDDLDPNDRPTWLAMAQLRAMCVTAKETLTAEPEVVVPLDLPGLPAETRIARAEFERAIRPAVITAVDVLRRAIRAGGRAAGKPGTDQIDALAIVGGSARIPLVAHEVAAAVPARVLPVPEPDAAAALGAAATAARLAGGPAAMPAPTAAERTELLPRSAMATFTTGLVPVDPDELDFAAAPPPRPPVDIDPLDLPDRRLTTRLRSGRRPAALTVGGLALVAAGAVLTFVFEAGTGARPATGGPLHIDPPQPAAQQSALPPTLPPTSPRQPLGNPANNPTR